MLPSEFQAMNNRYMYTLSVASKVQLGEQVYKDHHKQMDTEELFNAHWLVMWPRLYNFIDRSDALPGDI